MGSAEDDEEKTMAILIVEDEGGRRGFRVSEGTLAVGSGDGAGLRLRAGGVASVHVELEFLPGGAMIRAQEGVQPPLLGGQALGESAILAPGVPLQIGEARITLKAEAEEPGGAQAKPAQAAPKAKAGRAPAGKAKAAGTPRTAQPAAAGRSGTRRSGARASSSRSSGRSGRGRRGSSSSGLPAGVTPLLILAGVGGALFLGWRVFQGNVSEQSGHGTALARMNQAERHLDEGNFAMVEAALAEIPAGVELTHNETARLSSIRERLERGAAADKGSVVNKEGSAFLQDEIRHYERYYLGDEPTKPAVRMYLRRIAEFQRRFPDHPEGAWVERQAARFEGFASASDPYEFEDALWEAEYHTKHKPKDFKKAVAALEAYGEGAGDYFAQRIEEEIRRLEGLQADYYAERMDLVRKYWERHEDAPEAVSRLVPLVTGLIDEEMVDEAARYLVGIEGFDAYLRGYERDRPEQFQLLIANPIVERFAKRQGVL